MALTPETDQVKINPNVELEAIMQVFRVFEDQSKSTLNKLSSQIAEAQETLDKQAKNRKEELERRTAQLYAEGRLKADQDAAKFAADEMRKLQQEKLASEIETLKAISKENAVEREKQLSYLEKEKQVLELRAAGNEDEARQKEKELAKQKKKDKKEKEASERQKQDDEYEFGDILGNSIKDLTDLADRDPKVVAKQTAEQNIVNTLKGVGKAITDSLNAINSAISNYAKYQTAINSRLQGVSSYSKAVDTLSDVAFSPLLKAEDLYSNLSDLVGQGIVTNVEQRALFATVKDGIASTFDVTSDSLKRLIRVQQNDSTAARLGMEAYLTKFLNVYVENTEYLQSTFDTVSSSLLEASAMMSLNSASGTKASAELEFVVQKWLGTLSGVGFSESAAQSIAAAIGQLGSGDVDSLGSSDIQNLMVMAASKVGLSYGEMLNNGLDANAANNLMLGMVQYLQEVADTGTNVVKNQLAKVFGVTVSDLVAVSNLGNDALKTVHNDMLSYQNMYGELQAQFDELPERLGISNILENLFSNITYQTGMSIASNPATYALWKITDLIQGVTGGINIPFISVMGNGFDLNTTVENLMKLGIAGTSMLGNIGKIAGGLGSIGNGSALLKKLGVSESGATVKTFGGNKLTSGRRKSGKSTSETSYVGNTDSDTYYNSTINAANDEQQQKLDAKMEEAEDPVVTYLKDEAKLAERLGAIATKLGISDADFAAGSGEDAKNPYIESIETNSAAIIAGISTVNTSILSGIDKLDEILAGAATPDGATNTSNASYSDAVNSTANIQNSTEYGRYLSEQGIMNNTSTSISTVNADIGDYLSNIDFASGFKLLVDNVGKIKELLEEDNFAASSNEPISGFTQYTFDE